MSVFRAYDVRGVYPGEINEDLAFRAGAAFGTLNPGSIAVGCDVRDSGQTLKDALVRGLVSAGAEVTDIGVVPTPLVYFAAAKMGLDGGVVVTASHNPKEYNGLKFCSRGGVSLSYETGISRIEELVVSGNFRKGGGSVRNLDLGSEYLDFVKGKITPFKGMKLVIDAGNGVAGKIAPLVFESLGCEVTRLFCEFDGSFPNHAANPLEKGTLKQLQKKVVETGAALGIAYDGDGDRVGFVDENGNVIDNTHAFAFMIKNILKENPGAKILYDVLASKLIEDVITRSGGIPVVSRVGHSYMQKKMIDDGCVLAGESSGHYYFSGSFGYDDGIFASAMLVSMICGKSSGIASGLPAYHTSEDTRIHCSDEEKFAVVEKLRKRLTSRYKTMEMDGVKVFLDGGWFIVRASNTQPALVLRWESGTDEGFEKIKEIAFSELRGAGLDV